MYGTLLPVLFPTSKRFNCTQNILYLITYIRHFNSLIGSPFEWFTLDLYLSKPKIPRSVSIFLLIPSEPFVFGTAIALLGGSNSGVPSSTVWICDCRFTRLEIGPKMGVGGVFAAAVLNGRPVEVRVQLVCANAVAEDKFYVVNHVLMEASWLWA
ncbi:hypothetical protein NE237_028988 [Protea cynaroides]|uniref:Uncharacterized protein n=1 Tax=Protea cynaroides TaxID=273540 RepID=A0A9Q0JUC7_9MAGN|nr:hypothetical protein NE237_028988 [Protea cynaroides]